MPITIEARIQDFGLANRLALAPERTQTKAAKEVKAASFALERWIKEDMPVDTSRARASWSHWTPGDMVKPNPDAKEADAIWLESRDGLTITQGTNVPYVARLNEGHSQQAPAGFIDTNADKAAEELTKAIAELINEIGL